MDTDLIFKFIYALLLGICTLVLFSIQSKLYFIGRVTFQHYNYIYQYNKQKYDQEQEKKLKRKVNPGPPIQTRKKMKVRMDPSLDNNFN